MNGKDFVMFLIGALLIVLGIALVVIFWGDFVAIIKGILGVLFVIIGIVLAFMGFSVMRG